MSANRPCQFPYLAIRYSLDTTDFFKPILGFFVVLLIISLAPSPPKAGDAETLKQEKMRAKQLDSELREARQTLQDTLRNEKRVMSHLDHIEQKLSRSQAVLRGLRQQMGEVQNAIREARLEVHTLRTENRHLEDAFAKLLVAMYKTQQAGYPALIFGARSPNDAFRKYRQLMLIVRHQAVDLHELRDRILKLQETENELLTRKRELVSLLNAEKDQTAKIRDQRAEKERLLTLIIDRKDLQQKALRRLKESSAKLHELIRSLEKSSPVADSKPTFATGNRGFRHLKGRLPLPVTGRVRTSFGKQRHPLLRTYMVNNGIEIQATEGAEFKAVHAGVVIFSGWVQGYGKVIIMDHGDGYYTLCGHASRLLREVGDEVNGGEVIGEVGQTESWIGPSLYFEIREKGKAVDPLKWIHIARVK